SPAEAAGLKAGDRLVAFDGLDLVQAANRSSFLRAGRAVRPLRLGVKRGEKALDIGLVPQARNLPSGQAIGTALLDEGLCGKQVSVALVVDQVNVMGFRDSPEERESWKSTAKANVETRAETELLAPSLTACGNYRVVDRSKTQAVLAELKFQMTG